MGTEEADLRRRIVELEQELKALREKAGRYENLFANSPDLVYYMNREGKLAKMNDDPLDLLGYPNREDVKMEKYISLVVHPEDQERVIKDFYDCITAKVRDVKGLTFRIRKCSGEIQWVELYSRVNYDEKGEFLEEVGFLRDVTQRKEMEDRLIRLNGELEEANESLQAAYEWMRESHDYLKSRRYEEDMGFLLDESGRIEWSTEGALTLTGRTRTALIGRPLAELLTEDSLEAYRRSTREAMRGITELFPVRLRMEGEEAVPMDMKMSRLTSRDARRLWVRFLKPVRRP